MVKRDMALPQMLQKRMNGGSAVPICVRLPEVADHLSLWGEHQEAMVGDCGRAVINLMYALKGVITGTD